MKIEIEVEYRYSENSFEFVKLTKNNGETLHIFNKEAISFFKDYK